VSGRADRWPRARLGGRAKDAGRVGGERAAGGSAGSVGDSFGGCLGDAFDAEAAAWPFGSGASLDGFDNARRGRACRGSSGAVAGRQEGRVGLFETCSGSCRQGEGSCLSQASGGCAGRRSRTKPTRPATDRKRGGRKAPRADRLPRSRPGGKAPELHRPDLRRRPEEVEGTRPRPGSRQERRLRAAALACAERRRSPPRRRGGRGLESLVLPSVKRFTLHRWSVATSLMAYGVGVIDTTTSATLHDRIDGWSVAELFPDGSRTGSEARLPRSSFFPPNSHQELVSGAGGASESESTSWGTSDGKKRLCAIPLDALRHAPPVERHPAAGADLTSTRGSLAAGSTMRQSSPASIACPGGAAVATYNTWTAREREPRVEPGLSRGLRRDRRAPAGPSAGHVDVDPLAPAGARDRGRRRGAGRLPKERHAPRSAGASMRPS
jgi:hypothetical protein